MDGLFGSSVTLNCIYFALAAAGVVFALLTLLLGELFGDVDGGGDFDVGDGATDGDLVIFSPITLATFVTVFGAAGLVSTLGFNADARTSLIIAFVAATALSLLVAVVYSKILTVMQSSTNIRPADMVGKVGQVTVPVPPDGLGEAIIEISGERYIKAARSFDNAPIPRGATVVVKEVIGGVLVVEPRHSG